jgi:hypothetical protein
MSMVSLYEKLPDLAVRETRIVTLHEDGPGITKGEYWFVESYCDEPGCDCRTVFLNVVRHGQRGAVAVINYGWEPVAYYTKLQHGDEKLGKQMKGPALALMIPQSSLAPALLRLFEDVALDATYIELLKRHYRLFREVIDGGGGGREAENPASKSTREPSRNAPCPCGSGRKHNRCCGRAVPADGPAPDPAAADAIVRDRLKEFRDFRHEDTRLIERLVQLASAVPEMGASLARLLARDPDVRTHEDAQTLLFTAVHADGVPAKIRKRVVRDAVPILKSALQDPGVPDDRKFTILPILESAGYSPPQAEVEKAFRDYEGAVDRKSAEYMKQFYPSPESLEVFLSESGLVSEDDRFELTADHLRYAYGFAAQFAKHNPSYGGIALPLAAAIAVEHGLMPENALLAIRLASETREPAAAWCLAELGTWPALGDFGREARALAESMSESGVLPAPPFRRELSHGLITQVDGMGSRNLVLLHRTPQGGLDAISLLLNDERGIKDVWSALEDGAALEEKIRFKFKLALAPVTLPLARELVAGALAIHASRGAPPPGRFLLYRAYLGAEPIAPRRREPNLGAYALELLIRGPELADGSERLSEEPTYRELWFSGDAAYDFVRSHAPPPTYPTVPPVPDALTDRFVREVAAQESDRLIARMAANLELESWGGRAQSPANKLAARTWVVLSERVAPFHEVPFVRALARYAIQSIQINLALGFRSQREANDGRNRREGKNPPTS